MFTFGVTPLFGLGIVSILIPRTVCYEHSIWSFCLEIYLRKLGQLREYPDPSGL